MIVKNSNLTEYFERPSQIKPRATKFQGVNACSINNKKVLVVSQEPKKRIRRKKSDIETEGFLPEPKKRRIRRKKSDIEIESTEPEKIYRQKGPIMTHLSDEEYIVWLETFIAKLDLEDDLKEKEFRRLLAEGKSRDLPVKSKLSLVLGYLLEAELEFQEESKEQDTPKPENDEELFSYIKTKHSFHLVDPSPWPILASLGVLMLTTGFVSYMQKLVGGGLLLLTGLVLILLVMFVWWRDIIREATFEGHHSFVVQRGLRLGMILFIVSEIMFFFAFFWAFFHSSLSPTFNIGGVWPPLSISPIKTLGIPLTNTFFLLTSGATVTWAHHALLVRAKKHSLVALILTIILAFLFTSLQVLEYFDAPFNISDSVFGSCFYLTTGFHGFHVFVGAIALFVSLVRIVFNHYTDTHHFGLESGIWYWHFVDVVWLFLFVTVYWWGGKI